jgi:phosphatidylserine/phosphatidylglycerophosphate/cardiolipin synthase-like enzyme
MVIDGETGFIGGAGIADHWLYAKVKEPVWRDTVLQVKGEAVGGLLSAFAENWLRRRAKFFPVRASSDSRPRPTEPGALWC